MRHGLNVHQYADDTQLYMSVLSDDSSVAIERLDACLIDVKAWLRVSRLRLNPTKTQVMWPGSGEQLAKMDTDEVSLLASQVHVLDAARNLYVIFDSQLLMSAQVSAVCHTGYHQLRQLRLLVQCLSEDAAKILIQAFINTQRDYCNSLYFGIAVSSERRCMSCHWSQAVRSHYASPSSAALAASQPTSGFQEMHPHLSFVRWHRSCVPS